MSVIYSLRKAILRVRMCHVYVTISIMLLLLLLIGPRLSFPQVQVTEEWVTRYNGPGSAIDAARAIDVDLLGNVYVTGYSYGGDRTGYDYATISYDSLGNEYWVARYNGLSYYGDEAFAITTDSSGNVYVTGSSYYGAETDLDYTTVSYNSSGRERWVARYDGPGHVYGYDYDIATAVATDLSGNVYVTGYSLGSIGIHFDYATVSYDSRGNQRWVARYNGPASYDDVATAIAMDPSGNVYVTGYSASIGTHVDYITVSYDSSGNERWVARYNGPVNFPDYAYAIATDSSGNVYVTGQSYGDGTGIDYATVSYDLSGNERWVVRYNGPSNGNDWARAIDVDLLGNVYVTGYSYGGDRTSYDYTTISYDSSGNERWVARYHDSPVDPGGVVGAIAIDTDLSGNVYVTGTSWWNYWVSDYMTVSYDSLGNERWVARYHTPGLRNRAYDMVTDSFGNIYVTGSSGYDYATVKYSQTVRLPCEVPPDDGIPAEPSNDEMFIVSSTPFPTEPVVQQLQSQIEEVAPFVITDESGFQRVLSAAARRAGISAHALSLGHKIVSLNNRIVKAAIRDEEIHLPASEFAFIESFFQYQTQAGSHCGSFRSPTPCPPWVGSGVYFSVKDEVIQHLLSLGYHQTARYATTGGVYGDDYTLVVIHPTCGTGPFRTQAIIRQQEDCWTYSTQGTEPNSEFRSYTWPHVWWVGYVFWWHRFYCN